MLQIEREVYFDSRLSPTDLFTRIILPSTYAYSYNGFSLRFGEGVDNIQLGTYCALCAQLPLLPRIEYQLQVTNVDYNEYYFCFSGLSQSHPVAVKGKMEARRCELGIGSQGVFHLSLDIHPSLLLAFGAIKTQVDKILPGLITNIAANLN